MDTRARRFLVTLLAASNVAACQADLGVTARTWACASDAECIGGFVCRQQICVSEDTPDTPVPCVFTPIDPATLGLPDLSAFEAFRFVDLDGCGRPDLSAVAVDGAGAWLFEAYPGGYVGYVAAHGIHLQHVFGDVDGDGDEDAYFYGWGVPHALGLNHMNHFDVGQTDTLGLTFGNRSASAAFLDFDGDGDLDLFNYGHNEGNSVRFYLNDGDVFSEVAVELGLATTSTLTDAALGDLDGDGDLDLVFSSRRYGRETLVFDNLGAAFTQIDGDLDLDDRLDSSGVALGDYDGDGDLDLYVTNHVLDDEVEPALDPTDALFTATGGRFVEESAAATGLDVDGLDGAAPAFWDYDSDGRPDLVVGSYRGGAIQVYHNEGDGTFTRADAALGLEPASGPATPTFGDVDADGDLDLLYDGALYLNDCPSRGYLAVRVEVNPNGSTRVALGARVVVDPSGDGFAFPGSLMQEVTGSHNGGWLHFGLGDHRDDVAVRVVFPGRPGTLAERTVVYDAVPTGGRVVLRPDGRAEPCGAGPICEVGYQAPDCSGCAEPYRATANGVCEALPGCPQDSGWLVAGQVPGESHQGEDFLVEGTAEEPVVVDWLTGLHWRRCPTGMTWDGAAARCAGTPQPKEFSLAAKRCQGAYGGFADWRVPSLSELESLLNYASQTPGLGFPIQGVQLQFWSSTRDLRSGLGALLNAFELKTLWEDPEIPKPVLCVHGGSAGTQPRFAVHAADGSTVRDRWTGLEWARCANGQTWDAAAQVCDDPAASVSFHVSAAICATKGFRLPTAGELRSLRNFCTLPYYDAAAFGRPPNLELWSSTIRKDGQTDLAYVVRLDEADGSSRAVAVDVDGPALCVR